MSCRWRVKDGRPQRAMPAATLTDPAIELRAAAGPFFFIYRARAKKEKTKPKARTRKTPGKSRKEKKINTELRSTAVVRRRVECK